MSSLLSGHQGSLSLEKGTATHSRILAWRIPRTEESGGLQSMERVGHDSETNPFFTFFLLGLLEVVLGKGRTCVHLQTKTNSWKPSVGFELTVT